MLSKSTNFPTYLEDITHVQKNNIDIFVKLKNTYTRTMVVETSKIIESFMYKKIINYFELSYPFIIVKKLTKEIISEAIEAYASDEAYWLKLYHFAGKIDTAVFNQLQAEHMEYLKELDELDNF